MAAIFTFLPSQTECLTNRGDHLCCVRFPLVYMLSLLPRHSDWEYSLLILPVLSAFPALADRSACATSFSRIAQRSLTLRPAHSPSHLVTLYTRGFSHFVTSMTAPVASGWSKFAGWDSHPLRNAALARRTPSPDLQRRTKMATEAAAGTGTTCILRSLLTMTESPGAMRKSHCHAQVTSPETGPASSSSMVVILSSCNFKSVDGKFAIST